MIVDDDDYDECVMCIARSCCVCFCLCNTSNDNSALQKIRHSHRDCVYVCLFVGAVEWKIANNQTFLSSCLQLCNQTFWPTK
jgi:hypothetical protein